jgi:glycosyltransferase involved in cell wall biosynthesis
MESKNPLVTIYVPCRNYGRFLEKALKSIECQLYSNWELFIIDEGSEDNTLVISEYFKLKVSQRVEIIKNKVPVGLQNLANNVLSLANGKYIVRLDADDWFDEMALLLMVSKLESNSNLGLVYGNYYYTDEKGNILNFERKSKLGEEDKSNNLPPHGACTLIRTNILKSVAGYSEDLNAQDGWDIWFKIIQKTKAANLEAPIFYYRQHGNSLSKDSNKLFKARSKIFNKLNISLKNGDYKTSCLAIIPVKESYPNYKGVPYRKIKDKTLLQLSLESAQNSKLVTDVMVSSQSENVLHFAQDLVNKSNVKEHLRVKRTKEFSDENLHPLDILKHGINEYFKLKGKNPDIVLFLSLHAPFRKEEHINKAINVLSVQNCDSVVSVIEERAPMFNYGKMGLNLINPGKFMGLSHEKEMLFKFNGSVIACWSENVLNGYLFGEKIGYIEMNEAESEQIKLN